MPEFELWETADEGPELLILFGGEAGGSRITVLKAFVLGQRGIEFGGQEGEEEIQEINAKRIGDCKLEKFPKVSDCLGRGSKRWMLCLLDSKRIISAVRFPFSRAQSSHTDIPALREDNAQEEEEKEYAGANPAVGCVRG